MMGKSFCFIILFLVLSCFITSSSTAQSANSAGQIISQFQFKPYGTIKLDAAYDDSRTNYGNFVLYIPNESGNENDSDFNMTARQTKVGLTILAPKVDDWTAQGKFEMDFYGDGPTQHENKAEAMLRHAFLDIAKGDFDLLAGQTSDLISPLVPSTLNYTVLWDAGNIGYRRAQLRATYNVRPNDSNKLTYALAIARTSGLANEDLDGDKQNDGDDAGFPTVQARVAWTTTQCNNKEIVIGVSGHFGKEQIDFGTLPAGGDDEKVDTWSINGDLSIPLSDQLAITGEAFCGGNLDDYFGGVGQGVNTTTRDDIQSVGGWAQLNYKMNKKWQSNVGFGIDDPRNKDLNANNRSKNTVFYLNALFNITAPVTIGLEYSNWQTQYVNQSTGINNRIQTSFIYNW